MRITFLLLLAVSIGLKAQSVKMPVTKKVDQTDDYFGTKVNDPYRWLEDDNSEETKKWVDEENNYTFDYLKKIPFREAVQKRLETLWNFARQSAPFVKGPYMFFYKNNGMQNQNVLYVKGKNAKEAKILLDPNEWDANGTTSITSIGVSKNAKYMAYAISKAGSDWSTIRIIEVKTGAQVDQEIKWIKFSGIEWKGDEGFYYSKYSAPESGKEMVAVNQFQKVAFHKIGDIKEDEIVFEDKKNPMRGFYASLSSDERYLIFSSTESTTGNALFVKDLSDSKKPLITIDDKFEYDHTVLDIMNDTVYIFTNYKAPNKRIVRMLLSKQKLDEAADIVPESVDLLESVVLGGKGLMVLNYLHNVTSALEIRDMTGKKIHAIELPGIGKVNAINFGRNDLIGYIDFSTFTAPTAVYKLSLSTNRLTPEFSPVTMFPSDNYETKQVFYKSKDGTQIPMFIVAKKGIKLDGNNPCFLFGYGGFNVFYSPEFRIDRCLFLEQGGVYAIPGLRGGGDYGETWHKAGTIFNKQNVFDDFIAAAEYLCSEKYTNKNKLAIHGRSNGGLLIGAVMTQRPDLCKVALPTVGVLDMLRYHKFTIGWAWATDYGTSDDEKQFKYLFKYSPLHNVKETNYPATMVLTGDHDDRVVPAHSFKFAATLQEKNKSKEPMLIRIDKDAGHGAGKPSSKQIAEYADMWSFVFYNLGINPKY